MVKGERPLPETNDGQMPPPGSRRLRVIMYALIAVSSALQMALPPLLPTYVRRFNLTGVDAGVLLGATALATLAVSLPAGTLGQRFGPRFLTLFAGSLLAIGMFMQAVAPSFALLLVSRLLFGTGYGIVWITGLAWLAGTAYEQRSLGSTVVYGGVGSVLGPAIGGLGSQYLGLTTPFLAGSLVLIMLTIALSSVPFPTAVARRIPHLRLNLRRLHDNFYMLASLAAIGIASLAAGVSFLVMPIELHRTGASAGVIGLEFSGAAVIYIFGGIGTMRLGQRALSVPVVLTMVAILALAFIPAALSTDSMSLLLTLSATAVVRSVLWTLAVQLGAAGAATSGVGVAVFMGVLNGLWALVSFVSPVLAGALLRPIGGRAIFGFCALASAALGVTLWEVTMLGPLRGPRQGQ